MRRTIHRRIGLALMVGLALGAAINEVTFALLREESRPAQEIILLIPEGTAELVAAGEQPPAIPSAMSFVAGDRLLVVNEDLVDHQ
ncbi:MAG: hypothetical protein FJZ96_10715, partial [Chloroflexi bacterium]|nr:hypothetical protein [Chloroflexota bacterium]